MACARKGYRRALAVPVLAAATALGCRPAGAEDVTLHLRAAGGLVAEASATHALDGAHFCSAAPDPWTAPQERDARPAPFPFYRLIFGQGSPEDELDTPGPSIGLALSGYTPETRNHSDPINDSIELMLNGRHFVGHAGMGDPGARFAVTYRADRHGGGFVARHLREEGTGQAVIDVSGNWQCPPVVAGLPEQAVVEHKLFAGARPVEVQPTHLRLSHGPHGWRAIDQDTGAAFAARVDMRKIRIARALWRQAQAGRAELLVDATVSPGDPAFVIATALAGVQPTDPPQDALTAAR